MVYIVNASVLLATVANMICIGFGGAFVTSRMVGAWFASCLCVAHAGALVLTAVYRYNAMGMLCSLSTVSTNVGVDTIDDEWTYQADGRMIIFCFIIQLLTFVLFCFQGVCNLRPRTFTAPKAPLSQLDETPANSMDVDEDAGSQIIDDAGGAKTKGAAQGSDIQGKDLSK